MNTLVIVYQLSSVHMSNFSFTESNAAKCIVYAYFHKFGMKNSKFEQGLTLFRPVLCLTFVAFEPKLPAPTPAQSQTGRGLEAPSLTMTPSHFDVSVASFWLAPTQSAVMKARGAPTSRCVKVRLSLCFSVYFSLLRKDIVRLFFDWM